MDTPGSGLTELTDMATPDTAAPRADGPLQVLALILSSDLSDEAFPITSCLFAQAVTQIFKSLEAYLALLQPSGTAY